MDTDIKFVKSSKRISAALIDMTIVLFIRVFFTQIAGFLFINQALKNFESDFASHFGTETVKNNSEHIQFITQHPTFHILIALYIAMFAIGLLYHSYLNSSSWRATIGKRIMKIMIINDKFGKITFWQGVAHYILSILPITYVIYIFIFMQKNGLELFHAISYSETTIFFGFLSIIWLQIHSFTKRKTTAYDLICKSIFVEGKINIKFPWHKSDV